MRDHGLAYLEKLDAWLDGEDSGVVPLELLRKRGVKVPDAADLDDASVTAALWTLLRALTGIGVLITSTDHLSDRELYVRLTTDTLVEPTFLMPDEPNAFECYDLIGGGSEEDIATYLTYYADDEEREEWLRDFPDEPLPEKKPLPYDRDRLLETIESRVAASGLRD